MGLASRSTRRLDPGLVVVFALPYNYSNMSHHIVIDARNRRSSTGRYTDRLVQHLQDVDASNRYTILVQPDDDWQMRAGNFRTLPCPFPQFSFNPLDQLKFAWQVYRLKPDLVHFTMTQQPLLYFGKIVTTTHDLTMFKFVRRGKTPALLFWVKMRLYHFLMWWSHRKSARIIVPTNTTAKEVGNFQPFSKHKLVVTYEASEPPSAAKNVQPKGIEGVGGDFIMCLGTGFPHKNLPRMIEAFDLLHVTYPKLRLMLVGKTEKHYIELKEWAKNHPSYDHIVFTGFLPDEEAHWMYAHCRVYVLTSLSEGWGLPPLEAMTYGAPVACSNASVMPEVNGDAALYFDPHSPGDIATKVGEILDNPKLRAKLIAAGTKQVKKYSWRRMAEQTLDIYKDVLTS